MSSIKGKELAEYAFDVQTGLGSFAVPEFDELRTIGMAATLAVNLRGLPEIDYNTLALISDARFDIPAPMLKNVLRLLSEVNMVTLYESGRTINKIDPSGIPYFDDVYQKIGQVTDEFSYNEVEQATVAILAGLQKNPENKDKFLHKTGIDKELFNRVIQIGKAGGLITEHRARERSILVSPLYYADNSDALADLVARVGSDDFRAVTEAIQDHQGWPLSKIIEERAIAGNPLTPVQVELAQMMAADSLLKPPTIEFGEHKEIFLFTPRPGDARLSPAKREIYEKAMALLAAVRKGQLLPYQYRIRYPIALLNSLLTKGYLNDTSETFQQYSKVAGYHNIGYFEEISNGRHRFCLRQTKENKEAVELARDMAANDTQNLNMRTDSDARALLQKDEKYVRSVIGATAIKNRERLQPSHAAREQWEQLTLKI